MSKRKLLKSLEARCPYCNGKLGMDWSGNITCWNCRENWKMDVEGEFYEKIGKHVETWYLDKRKIQSCT